MLRGKIAIQLISGTYINTFRKSLVELYQSGTVILLKNSLL